MKSIAIAAVAHALLLVAPIAILGRWAEASRPGAIACIAALVVFAIAETTARKGVSDPSRWGAPGTRLALVSGLGLLVTAWAAIGFPASASASASACASASASALACASGVLLRVLALRALGDAFTSETVLVPGRAIVRRGIYARLRHPSDVGLLLFTAGLVGLSGSAIAILPALLLVIPSTALRMVHEDRLLATAS